MKFNKVNIFKPKRELLDFVNNVKPDLVGYDIDEVHTFTVQYGGETSDEVILVRSKITFLLSLLVNYPSLVDELPGDNTISLETVDRFWEHQYLDANDTFNNLCEYISLNKSKLSNVKASGDNVADEWIERLLSD